MIALVFVVLVCWILLLGVQLGLLLYDLMNKEWRP
jgi:hypothetical protein